MINALNKIDKKAKIFLFFFLNIIFVGACTTLAYGIYTIHFGTAYEVATLGSSVKLTAEYLLISLCECVGGGLLLDYVFRNPNTINR